MKRQLLGIAAVLVGVSGIVSCNDSGECAAACWSSARLRLYRTQWAAGEHELIVRYPRYDGMHEVSCKVQLPRDDHEIRCEGDGDGATDSKWVWVSVDATLDLRIDHLEAGAIELEVVPPEGEGWMKTVQPTYATFELCGSICGTANELIDLDE